MTEFDPAELARLTEAIDRPREWGTNDRAKHEFDCYVGTHHPAIVAALTRAQETEKAIERVEQLRDELLETGSLLTPMGRIALEINAALRGAALGGATTTTGDEA